MFGAAGTGKSKVILELTKGDGFVGHNAGLKHPGVQASRDTLLHG